MPSPNSSIATRALVVLAVLAIFGGIWNWFRSADRRLAVGAPTTLTGQVVDQRGPVPGACVRVKGSSESVTTDQHGRFHLRLTEAAAASRIAASKAGYYIASAPATDNPLRIELPRLPAEDHAGYQWVDPHADPAGEHNCANCHAEIVDQWAASSHAASATNRRFLNLYDGSDWQGRANIGWNLLVQHPLGAGVCTACHAPSVAVDEPAFEDLRRVRSAAAQGVHCDFCHKVVGVSTASIGLTHGRFGMQLLRPAEGQVFFGPLEDADRGENAFADVYRESRYCASCHEGIVFGVHVYGTYSEWLASDARRAGKSCQSCHMAPSGTLTNIAPGHGGIERDPTTLASHTLPGADAEMLRRALSVSVESTLEEQGLQAAIVVTADNVGHRVPTGFIDRHLVLVVEAFSADGEPLSPTSGPTLPEIAGNSVAGQAGRLYARVLQDAEGRSPAPFWLAQGDSVDTRLTPGEPDHSVYNFPSAARRLRVRAVYRRFWPQVREQKGWPDDELLVVEKNLDVSELTRD